MGKVVCVTGASGYIASWLVKLLLQRGYTVNATVTDISNPRKFGHLKELEGAEERLHLYEANLVEEASFDSALDGCEGVFHTASPVSFTPSDPQRELIDPAVNGTINVLKSCKKVSTIKRVVVTSSIASVIFNCNPLKQDVVVDETWYSDAAFCHQNKAWYALSKTLAEKATWKFVEENGLDLVTLHPALVIGPALHPTLSLSSRVFLDLIKHGKEVTASGVYRWVDVRDVALAHILAMENPSARGRYVLVGSVASSHQVFDMLSQIFPSSNFPPKKEEQTGSLHQVSQEKAKSSGINFNFTPLKVSIKGTVESFRDSNFITL